MNIKLSAIHVVEACLRYSKNYDNYHRNRLDEETVDNLIQMAELVECTSYSYVIINEKEFKLLRKYL